MTDAPSSSSTTPNNATMHRNLTIKPFIKQTDSNNAAVNWQRYKKEIERQFRFFGIKDPETIKDELMIYGGQDLVDIDDALPDLNGTEDDDAYKLLIPGRKMDNHFIPKKNKDFARFQLSELKQQSSERLAEYYAKIRNIAKKCEYADHEDDAIRDHLIRTMLNHKIRSKATIRDQRDYRGDDKCETSQTRRTRHVGNNCSDDSSSDDECFMNHLKTHHTSQDNADKWKTCTIQINGINIVAEPDSGSDTNIMDESQFAHLREQAPELKIKNTKIKLKALKEELPVIGEVNVEMSNATRTVSTTMLIIKGKIDSPPLIGRQTLEALGMLLIDVTGSLKSPNKTVKAVNKQQASDQPRDQNKTELDKIVNRYQQRFTGIGKAMRNGEQIQITVPMKDDATPIAQKPRRVPYQLTEPLKQRLAEFEENDIIEPVPEHEAITWCLPLVVQPKPKNPKDIRACLDLRLANKSMMRTRQVQAPITEDFIREFKGCKVFSKLDLNHEIAKIISGVPRVLNNRDDIMIGGLDWKDHNKNLQAVLQRIEDHNLTLRKEKCEFGKTSMTFHGHMFTTEGLKPSPDKIRAVARVHTTKDTRGASIILENASIPILIYQQLLKPLRASTAIDKKQREIRMDKRTANCILRPQEGNHVCASTDTVLPRARHTRHL
ncbi:Hypothetical predicted protein [Paramuricea clavata]|uniref:Uncharacterized protein n=1 Tax=Paramuricea clavata TaxID=317549 RepID=A0A6S7JFG6_PARCT|nr:Hypothetical predicted protein [Paramuricea clavata]